MDTTGLEMGHFEAAKVAAPFYGLRKCFSIKNIAFVQFFMNFSKKLSESRNLMWIFVF